MAEIKENNNIIDLMASDIKDAKDDISLIAKGVCVLHEQDGVLMRAIKRANKQEKFDRNMTGICLLLLSTSSLLVLRAVKRQYEITGSIDRRLTELEEKIARSEERE